jgi:hypothetical protein
MELRELVEAAEARMRKSGERPRGGIKNAALDEGFVERCRSEEATHTLQIGDRFFKSWSLCAD